MNKNRIGRFTITHDAFRSQWETNLLPIMGNFVIVDARYRYDTAEIEYLAYSPLFDVIDAAVAAPEYEIEIAMFPDAPAVIKAHRK